PSSGDGVDPLRIRLRPPEGNRTPTGGLDDQPHLRDPVWDELREMRPHLSPLPLLAAGLVGVGETGGRLGGSVLLEPHSHVLQTGHERVELVAFAAHRVPRSTTRLTTRPRSSTWRATSS